MATLNEAIKLEQARTAKEQWLQIHLFLDGTFLHAYEQSAWLLSRFGGAELQVKKHKTKQSQDGSYVMVGFPTTSIDKFRPKESTEQTPEDKHIILTFPDATFPAETTAELLLKDFQHWKDELPFTEENSGAGGKKKDSGKTPVTARTDSTAQVKLTDMMHDVLAYPLEGRSPIDTMLFVAELKRKLSSIL